MRKEVFIHLSFLFTFFILMHLAKGWFSFSFYPLWIGGILGTFLPDIDHLLYVYLIKPEELNSLRIKELISKRKFASTIKALFEGRRARGELIFHTVLFQLLFLVLTFLIITSSGSIFGRGLVLGLGLHLLVDQLVDFLDLGSLENWFRQFPLVVDRQKDILYWVGNVIVLLFFAFFL
ncbi:metal-dependent hydrolase [Patescibacteria group bacterium]|nr:metal-dependent hydrolase [Patescibacteria group bacterium]